MAEIVVRSAVAAEDIRREQSGKPMIIGLLNPIIGFDRARANERSKMKLHFLLAIDVPEPGAYELDFRLRGLESRRGPGARIKVTFTHGARNIPFPIGPMTISIDEHEHGFRLQQRLGERWKTISTWQLQDDPAP